ncbi:rCG42628, isoform CRA_a [Rattus norvegicus]|uniref:RCG42628, isoform CRA_a n=1 Tax=Rattus norvegicus TaxID=10116 RepID=A6K1P9_RAT|nr:rCG42628, isoform CRA_a [Rattus norvegicus]
MEEFPLLMPSGTSLWHLVLGPTTMPSGGTSTCPAHCRPRCLNEWPRLRGSFGLWDQSIMGSELCQDLPVFSWMEFFMGLRSLSVTARPPFESPARKKTFSHFHGGEINSVLCFYFRYIFFYYNQD